VIQQRGGRDRGNQRREQPTDQRHDRDGDQVEQHLAGHAQDVTKPGQTRCQQGKNDQPGQRSGEPVRRGQTRGSGRWP
jgi:hypothetical protein